MVSFREEYSTSANQNCTSILMPRLSRPRRAIHEEYYTEKELFCPTDFSAEGLLYKKWRQRKVHFLEKIVSDVWERPYTTTKQKFDLFYTKRQIHRFRKEFRAQLKDENDILTQETVSPTSSMTSRVDGLFSKTATVLSTLSRNNADTSQKDSTKREAPSRYLIPTKNDNQTNVSSRTRDMQLDTMLLVETLYLF
mmetsp:Transcript_7129/g.10396  ORF Transcript_7129/g.10396 Transcript_7129/m.10396 type:complete len:195 (-) Transcript_7129:80-664(-)